MMGKLFIWYFFTKFKSHKTVLNSWIRIRKKEYGSTAQETAITTSLVRYR